MTTTGSVLERNTATVYQGRCWRDDATLEPTSSDPLLGDYYPIEGDWLRCPTCGSVFRLTDQQWVERHPIDKLFRGRRGASPTTRFVLPSGDVVLAAGPHDGGALIPATAIGFEFVAAAP